MEAGKVESRKLKRDRLNICIEAVWLSVIFLIPLYVNPFGYASFSVAKSFVLQFLASLLLGLALAQWFLRGRGIRLGLKTVQAGIPLLTAAVFTYGLFWALATACSIMPERSFWGNQVRETGLITMLAWIAVFTVMAQRMRRREQVYRALFALVMSAALMSLLGIVQFYLGWSLLNGRVYSTDGNPLQLSAFLSMVIPANLALLIMAWDNSGKEKRKLSTFIFSLAAFILIIICLVLAQYSVTLLLYVVGLFTFFSLVGLFLQRRTTFALALFSLMLLAVIALVLMGNIFMSAPEVPVRNDQGSMPAISEQVGLTTLGIRVQTWWSAVQIILEQPEVPFHQDNMHALRRLVGYGPCTFGVLTQLNFPASLRSEYTFLNTLIGQPENHYLYLAATAGIPGLLAFIAVLGLFFYTGLRLLRRATERSLILPAAACLAGVFQYCVHLLFNPSTIDPEMVFWLSLALVPALARIEDDAGRAVTVGMADAVTDKLQGVQFVPGLGRKALAACIFLAFTGIGIMIVVNPFLADLKLRSAINKFASNDRQAALAEFVEATNIQPRQPAYHGFLGRAAYLMAQQTDNAEEKSHLLELSEIAYGEASRLESGIAFWHYTMGDVYTYRMLNGDRSKWADALHAYETADGFFPDNAVILNKWALALMLGGDYEEAGYKLQEAQRSDPLWGQTCYYRGLLLMHDDKPCAAAGLMGEAFKNSVIEFKDFSYFMDFCSTAKLYGRASMVADSLSKCHDEFKGDWIKLSLLGIAELFDKNPGGAFEAFSQAAEIVPPGNATVLAGMMKGIFPAGSPWHERAGSIAGRLIEKAKQLR